MKHGIYTATALALLAGSPAFALGLDRSNQDIGIIFEQGGFAELSFGSVKPSISGTDVMGNATGDIGNDFATIGLGVKMDFTPQWSGALTLDQPFGVDVAYDGAAAETLLGGTAAELNSQALTLVGRYRINENFSAHAGLRSQSMDANVTLSGLAFGGLSGYNVKLENGSGTGWLAGVAYERPDIALRVALTYNSAIDNEFDTVENHGAFTDLAGTTTVTAPEAWNLDFQTGVAADTLVFGSIRYAAYSQTVLRPDGYVGSLGQTGSITNIKDGTSWTLGVGRRFTPEFSGQVAIGYEASQDNPLVSPLAPTSGIMSISVGGAYTIDNITISGGIRYGVFGDATAETAGTGRAPFEDNDLLAIGMSVGYRF